MKICPECKSNRLRYSKARTKFEMLWRNLSNRHIYRCQQCNWRGISARVKKSATNTSAVSKKTELILYGVAAVLVLLLIIYIMSTGDAPPPAT